MKKKYYPRILLTAFIIIAVSIIIYSFDLNDSLYKKSETSLDLNNTQHRSEVKESCEEDEEAGPKTELMYFEQQHYPYGAILEQSVLSNIWSDVKNTPDESDVSNSSTSWLPLGPYGSQIPATNTRYCGRILDINARDTTNLKIAAASGGLWSFANPNPIALTEPLTSQAASTFDIQPGNLNVIILGTGEPLMRAGTGMYRTTNGGLNWASVNLNDTTPGGFYKIRYSSANVIHAASNRGYFRSDDNGLNWVKPLSGDITDVAVNPNNNSLIYCARRQNLATDSGGVYKSTDNGLSWNRMTNGIPVSDVGRTSISISKSNSAFIFVLMATRGGDMQGVYRTAGGDAWIDASPSTDIFDGIGWYANAIAVSPTSSSKIFIGGIWLWRSTNLGISWQKLDIDYDLNIHADQHSIVWDSTGTSLWAGNDGGVSFTNDDGFSFNTLKNKWPITQYYNVDVALSNPTVFVGSSQDNGVTSTTNTGSSWKYNISWGGDGCGAAVSPFNPAEMYMTIGVFGGALPFKPHRTTNGGDNWSEIINGISGTTQWFTRIKTDNADPITIYTNAGGYFYSSTNKGDNWIKRNFTELPSWITNFSVRKYNDTTVIYALTDSRNTGERIFVKVDTAGFVERSAAITDGYGVNAITMHPTNSNTAFAVIKGLFSGQKLYKTTNRGVNWINVSSNLPNVPATVLAIYPANDNILYLGSEMGCYKSTNAGANWFRWNDGMPEAMIISELKPYFSGSQFHILAGTYGRGMWDRIDDDLLNTGNTNNEVPSKFALHQNYPNPFNPITKIKFDIAKQSFTKVIVYDVSGREVEVLVNKDLNAGSHEVDFNATNFASGVYFYKLTSGDFTAVKKMMVVK